MCFNWIGIFRFYWSKTIVLWLLHIVQAVVDCVYMRRLGTWVFGDDISRSIFLNFFLFVGWLFCSSVSVSSVIFWPLWPVFEQGSSPELEAGLLVADIAFY